MSQMNIILCVFKQWSNDGDVQGEGILTPCFILVHGLDLTHRLNMIYLCEFRSKTFQYRIKLGVLEHGGAYTHFVQNKPLKISLETQV